ncbi:MAG: hypothetical protein WCA20_18810, partial [Candidatus Sulfotelmatobacter sp.]
FPIVDTSEGDAITVNWEKPHFLTVSTGDSHVRLYGNLWYSKRVPDYYVELTLSTAGRHYLQENGKLRGQASPARAGSVPTLQRTPPKISDIP